MESWFKFSAAAQKSNSPGTQSALTTRESTASRKRAFLYRCSWLRRSSGRAAYSALGLSVLACEFTPTAFLPSVGAPPIACAPEKQFGGLAALKSVWHSNDLSGQLFQHWPHSRVQM